MLASLPEEVWSLIASHLVYVDSEDRRGASELWQVHRHRPNQNDQKRVHPLKAFGQTCKFFAQIALPKLWRDVHLYGSNTGDLYDLGHLIQLDIALDDPRIANIIQRVSINARRDEVYGECLAVGRTAEVWEEMEIRLIYPTIEDFLNVVGRLGRKLTQSNLREFVWRGTYRPPASFYDSLSQCQTLRFFTLDLGSCWLPTAYPGDYPVEDDALDRLASLITEASLGFGAETSTPGMRSDWDAAPDGCYYDLRDTRDGRRGSAAGIMRWLHGSNRLPSLHLAAPVLYHQPILLPLWAKLTPKDIDQEVVNAGEEFCYHFGEPVLEVDLPYERAAKAFRPLLLNSDCQSPEEVLQLIKDKEELQIWQKWHLRLEGETKDIMEKVIAVLRPDEGAA